MGNRCIITDIDKNVAVYLHWDGDRYFVESACKYCELKNYRDPTFDPSYAMARLTQVIANYLGGDTGIGIFAYTNDEGMCDTAWDHGVYVIGKGWQIDEHIDGGYGDDDVPGFSWPLVMSIDAAQPEREQLGVEKIVWYRDGCPEIEEDPIDDRSIKAVKMFIGQQYDMNIVSEFDNIIVADDPDGSLVFIVVKTVSGDMPDEDIDRSVFEKIALDYLRENPNDTRIVRFDIATVVRVGEDKGFLRYHTNALNAGV